MIRKFFVCTLLVVFSSTFQTSHAQAREYDDLLISEVEQLSFSEWWGYFISLANSEGVYPDSSDREYFRVYYFDEGYDPEEAFYEEY